MPKKSQVTIRLSNQSFFSPEAIQVAAERAGRELILIIRERTLRGEFARSGSSGTRARRYDPDYASQVGKSVSGPVNLTISGALLAALRPEITMNGDQVSIEAVFSSGSAQQKKKWLQDLGAGAGRIKRRFVYVNKAEAHRVTRLFMQTLFRTTKKRR